MILKVFSNLNDSMMKLIPDILFEDKPSMSAAVACLQQCYIKIKHLYSAPQVGNSLVTQDPHGGRRLLLNNDFKGDILLLGEQMPTQQLDKCPLRYLVHLHCCFSPTIPVLGCLHTLGRYEGEGNQLCPNCWALCMLPEEGQGKTEYVFGTQR